MAKQSVAPVRNFELTEEKRLDLAIHNFVADSETVTLLLKAQGVAQLVRDVTSQLEGDEPMPQRVQTSIWVIQDLIDEALRRAGCGD